MKASGADHLVGMFTWKTTLVAFASHKQSPWTAGPLVGVHCGTWIPLGFVWLVRIASANRKPSGA
jgi:hypothetical protein